MQVGFIGLGIMGAPMAEHLIAGGHSLAIFGGRRVPDSIRGKATQRRSMKDVAETSEVIILMVPDTPDVEAVLFGADGVAAGLKTGKIVVDMSSISPIETKKFAARINELGCEYLDAPVSGGEVGAKPPSLTIMIGGAPAAFDKAKPPFSLIGRNTSPARGN